MQKSGFPTERHNAAGRADSVILNAKFCRVQSPKESEITGFALFRL